MVGGLAMTHLPVQQRVDDFPLGPVFGVWKIGACLFPESERLPVFLPFPQSGYHSNLHQTAGALVRWE